MRRTIRTTVVAVLIVLMTINPAWAWQWFRGGCGGWGGGYHSYGYHSSYSCGSYGGYGGYYGGSYGYAPLAYDSGCGGCGHGYSDGGCGGYGYSDGGCSGCGYGDAYGGEVIDSGSVGTVIEHAPEMHVEEGAVIDSQPMPAPELLERPTDTAPAPESRRPNR
jgi:hypothetical protein